MIFEKILKASPSSFSKRSKEGEIINFIQVDSQKISNSILQCPSLLVSPIQIVIYTYMLFNLFGFPFLFGFGIMLIFLIANFIIQSCSNKFNKKTLEKKDNRLKVTTEAINSIKILKLYAWEDEFLNRVYKLLLIVCRLLNAEMTNLKVISLIFSLPPSIYSFCGWPL